MPAETPEPDQPPGLWDLEARLWLSNEDASLARTVHVVDIGFGGLALVGDSLPHVGVRVVIALNAAGFERPIELKGNIAWRRPESRLGNLAGVGFGPLSADVRSRLRKWLSAQEQ